jgi:hypothetical protein
MAPTIPAAEYHRVAKAIFKRAITSFANEQWDRVITDGGKIEQTALRWQKEPADRTKEKEHDAATSGLAAAGRKLAAAAEAKEAAAVSNALGMVAERLAQLRNIDPMGAAEAEKPPARPATNGAGANGAVAPKAPAAGPEAAVPPVSPRTPILPPGDPGKK